MDRKKFSKRKEAEVESPQQPQDLSDKAAQPEQLVEGNSSLAAANLQSKMKEAAKIFVELSLDIGNKINNSIIEPGTLVQIRKVSDRLFAEAFSHYLYRTPLAVMLKLEDGWIKVTKETVAEATAELDPDVIAGRIPPATRANLLLMAARDYCSRHKKVGWVLPKRKGGVWK